MDYSSVKNRRKRFRYIKFHQIKMLYVSVGQPHITVRYGRAENPFGFK